MWISCHSTAQYKNMRASTRKEENRRWMTSGGRGSNLNDSGGWRVQMWMHLGSGVQMLITVRRLISVIHVGDDIFSSFYKIIQFNSIFESPSNLLSSRKHLNLKSSDIIYIFFLIGMLYWILLTEILDLIFLHKWIAVNFKV